jgi:hypothetical protein
MPKLDLQEERLSARDITQKLWKLAAVAFVLVPIVGVLTFLVFHVTIGAGTRLAVGLGLIFGPLWVLAAWNLNFVRKAKRLFPGNSHPRR